MVELKLSELVFDYDLYPRSMIDSQHVSSMVEALAAGRTLPPIIVEKKTKRVVEGWKRCRAYRRHFGAEATIPAELKTYRSDAEFYLDACRYNRDHGQPFTSYDRTRSAVRAQALGLSQAQIAEALGISVERIESSLTRTTAVSGSGKAQTIVPLKGTIRHMAGRNLNARQREANDKLGGMPARFFIEQLITLMESDLIDRADRHVLEALKRLEGSLEKYLEGEKALSK